MWFEFKLMKSLKRLGINFFILIIYKIYIYDVINSIVGSTSEPWNGNFFNSMIGLTLETLLQSVGFKMVNALALSLSLWK